ncbi:hypothetical protein KR026_003802, partial [Drosophila bipectinata]
IEMNQDAWSLALGDDSDKSSSKSSRASSRSTDSSNESSCESSIDTPLFNDKRDSSSGLGSSYEIISRTNLNAFVQKIDLCVSLDDQAYDILAKVADAFVNDVALRIVKLAKYRRERVGFFDLKFILKREYNMEFAI